MGMLHPSAGPHRVHTIHRVSAAAVGGFLILFAVLGFTQGLALLSTRASWVMGLSSNGLLSVLSLVVGLVLVGAASHSGPMASSVSIVMGVLFLLSGLGNTLVLGTAMNLLAFRLPNIVFSLVLGTLLLILGSYGRLTGGLPPDNPYRQAKREIPEPRPAPQSEHLHIPATIESATIEQLAEAERAAALHYATTEQLRRLALVHAYRRTEDRLQAWQSSSR